MLFNSLEFLLFFAVVFLAYSLLPLRGQNYLLLAASYVFYGAWDVRFLLLLIGTTVLDYACARGMQVSRSEGIRKILVCTSLAANLGVLFLFKYFGFFMQSFSVLANALGFQVHTAVLTIVLPVGISFYTFQAISYSLDVYARRIPAVRNLADFALYVAFFPQLVAGPIERANDLLPQLQHSRQITWQGLRTGIFLFFWGMFKKCVVADNLAPLADGVFGDPSAAPGAAIGIATVAFAFQIYGDFSGYTDMARGVASVMGFRLSQNFFFPYFANDIREFWHRWHITLSQWFRDYVYIPLGGNRRGLWATSRNIWLTFLLAGLWHGASWHFVAWGFYHGTLLVLWHRWASRAPRWTGNVMPTACKIILTFLAVSGGWVLFRVSSMSALGSLIRSLITNPCTNDATWTNAIKLLFFAGLLTGLEFIAKRYGGEKGWLGLPALSRVACYAVILCSLLLYGASLGEPFIYFQF